MTLLNTPVLLILIITILHTSGQQLSESHSTEYKDVMLFPLDQASYSKPNERMKRQVNVTETTEPDNPTSTTVSLTSDNDTTTSTSDNTTSQDSTTETDFTVNDTTEAMIEATSTKEMTTSTTANITSTPEPTSNIESTETSTLTSETKTTINLREQKPESTMSATESTDSTNATKYTIFDGIQARKKQLLIEALMKILPSLIVSFVLLIISVILMTHFIVRFKNQRTKERRERIRRRSTFTQLDLEMQRVPVSEGLIKNAEVEELKANSLDSEEMREIKIPKTHPLKPIAMTEEDADKIRQGANHIKINDKKMVQYSMPGRDEKNFLSEYGYDPERDNRLINVNPENPSIPLKTAKAQAYLKVMAKRKAERDKRRAARNASADGPSTGTSTVTPSAHLETVDGSETPFNTSYSMSIRDSRSTDKLPPSTEQDHPDRDDKKTHEPSEPDKKDKDKPS